MSPDQFHSLLSAFYEGTLTRDDAEVLTGLLHDPAQKSILESFFNSSLSNIVAIEAPATIDFIYREIQLRHGLGAPAGPGVQTVHRVHFLKTAWFRYAAAVIVLVGLGVGVWVTRQRSPAGMTGGEMAGSTPGHASPDILPGGNKAVLTLADGSTIVLDSAANGSLAQQGATKIIKLHAGSLVYNAGQTGANGEVLYNTISTPKGGLYQVTLPDGSQVWLNAASSVRFPTVFVKDRKISITGEVYFEIASDKNKPFSVTANGTAVHVLGTSFNINAYTDGPAVKTSLLEGAVQVDNHILKPGQAFINGRVVASDVEQDVAWKNGYFNFNKVSLEQAMRQISNWYDVEIVYEQGIPNITFGGKMERRLTLSSALKFMSKMGVHYRMEGRRIIIVP